MCNLASFYLQISFAISMRLSFPKDHAVIQSTLCQCRAKIEVLIFLRVEHERSLIALVAGANKRSLTKTMISENRFFCRYTRKFGRSCCTRHNDTTFLQYHWKIENCNKEILAQNRLHISLT